MWGKRFLGDYFFFSFFSSERKKRLNSAGPFCVAGAPRGSPHRCTFCKAPGARRAGLRGAAEPGEGSRQEAAAGAAGTAPAAAATDAGRGRGGAQHGRTCAGSWGRAAPAAPPARLGHPAPPGGGRAGNGKPPQPPPPAPGGQCDDANALCDGSLASCCGLLRFSKMTYD